jgi:cytochrome c-type biogenesis protein CcmE
VNPRTKFLIGFLLVAGTSGYLMASSIRETGMYYFTPSELAAKVAADPGFRDVGIKVGARVVPGSIVRDPAGREVQFFATDGAKTIPVIYRGIAPDTFTDSADVIVEGRLDASGTFQATVLLAKCASRFEAAPDKYRDTPGYQAATKRTS